MSHVRPLVSLPIHRLSSFGLCLASGATYAQDAPGLGIGLFAVFILLPMLPFVLLPFLAWVIYKLVKNRRSNATETYLQEEANKPPISRLGE